MKQFFNVTGMSCAACSAHVEKAVSKLPGMSKVSVNLLKGTMITEFDEKQTSVQQIIATVQRAGYGASPRKSLTGLGPSKGSNKPISSTQANASDADQKK